MNFIKNFRMVIYKIVVTTNFIILSKIYHMNISRSARISHGAYLDKTNPRDIYVGDESFIAYGAMILTHDFSRGLYKKTCIGNYCFIGARAIILPGVSIGDHVIVGAGSVVTKDVPPNCIIAGNPAKVIRENVTTTTYGKLL